MMGRALLVVGALATAGLVVAAVMGYRAEAVLPEIQPHVLVALASSLLCLFSHCWIMFYLIGTGKAIKEAVRKEGLETQLVEATRQFKSRCFPWALLAMAAVMATFIVGGGVATAVLPTWLHHGLFWIALLIQVRALWLEFLVLEANERLIFDINRRLAPA